MLLIVLFICSFLIALYLIPRILLISLRKRLINHSNGRTVHTQTASRLGGAAFFPSTVVPMIVVAGCVSFVDPQVMDQLLTLRFLFGISALFLMYLLGVIDDVADLRYRTKFLFQILAGGLIVSSGVYIHTLHGVFGIWELPNWVAYPFSIFLILFITNAINLIDGIDGLAASLSVIALLVIALMLYSTEEFTSMMLAISTLGALAAFIRYNLFGFPKKSSKIFMGDSGSLFLGGVLSLLIFKLCNLSGSAEEMADLPQILGLPKILPSWGERNILLAWSVLFVPCIDVLRVMWHRFRNGQPVFRPDKNHIHHKLMACGFTQRETLVWIVWVALFVIAFNMFLSGWVPVEVIFLIDILLWTVGNLLALKKTYFYKL